MRHRFDSVDVIHAKPCVSSWVHSDMFPETLHYDSTLWEIAVYVLTMDTPLRSTDNGSSPNLEWVCARLGLVPVQKLLSGVDLKNIEQVYRESDLP